jgi:hypothetical protein
MLYDLPPAQVIVIEVKEDCKKGSRECFPENRRGSGVILIQHGGDDGRGSGRVRQPISLLIDL